MSHHCRRRFSARRRAHAAFAEVVVCLGNPWLPLFSSSLVDFRRRPFLLDAFCTFALAAPPHELRDRRTLVGGFTVSVFSARREFPAAFAAVVIAGVAEALPLGFF